MTASVAFQVLYPGRSEAESRDLVTLAHTSPLRQEGRVVDSLPEMAVGVLEVAGIAAPEGLLRRFHDSRAGLPRPLHDGIDLRLAGDVVAQRELGRAATAERDAGIVRDVAAREERQLQARLQVEEGDGALLELRAEDALGRETQAVAIEADGRFEIVDAEGNDAERGVSWLLLPHSRACGITSTPTSMLWSPPPMTTPLIGATSP